MVTVSLIATCVENSWGLQLCGLDHTGLHLMRDLEGMGIRSGHLSLGYPDSRHGGGQWLVKKTAWCVMSPQVCVLCVNWGLWAKCTSVSYPGHSHSIVHTKPKPKTSNTRNHTLWYRAFYEVKHTWIKNEMNELAKMSLRGPLEWNIEKNDRWIYE